MRLKPACCKNKVYNLCSAKASPCALAAYSRKHGLSPYAQLRSHLPRSCKHGAVDGTGAARMARSFTMLVVDQFVFVVPAVERADFGADFF